MRRLRHRKMLVRNTLTELEAAFVEARGQGWQLDPDFHSEMSISDLLECVHDKKMPINVGVFREEIVSEDAPA